jgi:hypothetical protein
MFDLMRSRPGALIELSAQSLLPGMTYVTELVQSAFCRLEAARQTRDDAAQ